MSAMDGLIKSLYLCTNVHTQSKIHTKELHLKLNVHAETDSLSFTQIPAVCEAQTAVFCAGTGPRCLFVPQSHQSHLKTHSLLLMSALPQRKTATHNN